MTNLLVDQNNVNDLIHRMRCVQPQTFDHFSSAALRWYEHEAEISGVDVPNIFALLQVPSVLGENLLEIFMDSMIWRRYEKGLIEKTPEEMTDEEWQSQRMKGVEDPDDFYDLVIGDLYTFFDALRMHYTWDETETDPLGDHYVYRNHPVKGVW